MVPISLPEPIPRQEPKNYTRFNFDVIRRDYLDVPNHGSGPDFWAVLQRRESRRTFGYLEPTSLCELLWYSAKSLTKPSITGDARREHRHLPSAGGLHPVHLIIQTGKEDDYKIFLYDSIGHALCELTAELQYRTTLRAQGYSAFGILE
jgi:hypothetical protein